MLDGGYQRFPKDRTAREEEWRWRTGKSPHALYRKGRELKAEGLR